MKSIISINIKGKKNKRKSESISSEKYVNVYKGLEFVIF